MACFICDNSQIELETGFSQPSPFVKVNRREGIGIEGERERAKGCLRAYIFILYRLYDLIINFNSFDLI